MVNQKITAILSKYRERRSAVGEEYATSKGLEELLTYLKDILPQENTELVREDTVLKGQLDTVVNISEKQNEQPKAISPKPRPRKW